MTAMRPLTTVYRIRVLQYLDWVVVLVSGSVDDEGYGVTSGG
jgi:hypothetical protein